MSPMDHDIKHQLYMIAQEASRHLWYEAQLAPKPGLVDWWDHGAHQDMTIQTFYQSSQVMTEGFFNYLKAGWMHQSSLPELFVILREIGMHLEEKMLEATEGVNTHKGAIFSFGIVLGSLGYLYQQHQRIHLLTDADRRHLQTYCQMMVKKILTEELKQLRHQKPSTVGIFLWQHYGISGARGLAISGYSIVFDHIEHLLTYYDHITPEVMLKEWLSICSEIEDSNLYARGGALGASWFQNYARRCYKTWSFNWVNEINAWNELCQMKQLSPGGAADMLGLSLFLLRISASCKMYS